VVETPILRLVRICTGLTSALFDSLHIRMGPEGDPSRPRRLAFVASSVDVEHGEKSPNTPYASGLLETTATPDYVDDAVGK